MSRRRRHIQTSGISPLSPHSPDAVRAAARALEQRLRARTEIDFEEVLRVVLGVLPPAARRRMRGALGRAGLLEAGRVLPCDVLDSPGCPRALRGSAREFARLALFGLSGEGTRSEAKNRDAVYQRCTAMILRETRDLQSLRAAGNRALALSEVRGDPALAAMLRSFIAGREQQLRVAQRTTDDNDTSYVEVAFSPTQSREKRPLKDRVSSTLGRLRAQLEDCLARYHVSGAKAALEKLEDLRKRYPAFVEAEVVAHCQQQVAQLAQRRFEFREQLSELTRQAVQATKTGDQRRANWILRRLDAIHMLLPAVLPSDHYAALRDEIQSVTKSEERHDAARALVRQEQEIGARIKQLGGVIHRYYKLLDAPDVDPELMKRAKAAYERAVGKVAKFDDDWLADMMLELDTLLADLDDPQGRAEQQVNRFIENVRRALERIREQIQAIHGRRDGAGG